MTVYTEIARTGWLGNGVGRPFVGLVRAAPDGGPAKNVSAGKDAKPFNVTIGSAIVLG